MPNRVIKESIKRSPQIDSLTWFEEVVFYRLIVTADDYGCVDGRPVLLKNELFPTKDTVTRKSVEDAIRKLVSAGLLRAYEVNGMPYLLFPTWEKHQRIRNKRRKYPEPTGESYLPADCCQMSASCPPESESNPNPESESESESNPRAGAFAEFWAAYPRPVGREAARRAFAKVPKEAWPLLVPAINAQKLSRQWQKDGGQYIPNPATWLNQGRWEDEAGPAQAQTNNPFLRQLMEEESHG